MTRHSIKYNLKFLEIMRRVNLADYLSSNDFPVYIADLYSNYVNLIISEYGEIDLTLFCDGVYSYGLNWDLVIHPIEIKTLTQAQEDVVNACKTIINYDKRILIDKSKSFSIDAYYNMIPVNLSRPELDSYDRSTRLAGEISLLVTYILEDTKNNILHSFPRPNSKTLIRKSEIDIPILESNFRSIILNEYFRL